jgi:hypothetical protein
MVAKAGCGAVKVLNPSEKPARALAIVIRVSLAPMASIRVSVP